MSVPNVVTINGRLVAVTPGKPNQDLGPAPKDGKSAYQLAQQMGFGGTLAQWLESLKAPAVPGTGGNGLSAYQLAQQQGYTGTLQQWLASLNGTGANGLSAYQLALGAGFSGTLQQWLDSLKAPATGNQPGLSAYQLAQQNGFTGTQTDWLASLKSTQAGLSAYQVAQQAGFTGDVNAWLASLKSTQPGPASTVPGKSAYEIAQAAGFTGTQQQWLDSLKSTAPSTVAGKSAFEVAVANGFTGTQAQWLASLQGPQGVAAKAGMIATAAALLAAGTTLLKGVVYWYSGTLGAWLPLRPISHERGQGQVAMVDSDGDLIANGNPVKAVGFGLTLGRTYYVETPDPTTGKNLVLLPDPMPASLNPSLTRSFFSAGVAFAGQGGVPYLGFALQVGVAPGASAANFRFTTFTNLPYGQTPSSALMRRLVDVPNNGGAPLTGLRADGDSDTDSGVPASPVKLLVNGVLKGVFFQTMGYDNPSAHATAPTAWPAAQGGDYLMTFAAADIQQTASGFIFAASATEFWTVRLYSGVLSFQHFTVSGSTLTSVGDYRSGVNLSTPSNTLLHLRLNLSADGKTVSTRLTPYDTGRTLANQAAAESSAWTATYTASTPFPVGYVEALNQNGKLRLYLLSMSSDPTIPAQFDGDAV